MKNDSNWQNKLEHAIVLAPRDFIYQVDFFSQQLTFFFY